MKLILQQFNINTQKDAQQTYEMLNHELIS